MVYRTCIFFSSNVLVLTSGGDDYELMQSVVKYLKMLNVKCDSAQTEDDCLSFPFTPACVGPLLRLHCLHTC